MGFTIQFFRKDDIYYAFYNPRANERSGRWSYQYGELLGFVRGDIAGIEDVRISFTSEIGPKLRSRTMNALGIERYVENSEVLGELIQFPHR